MLELGDALVEFVQLRTLAGDAGLLEELVDPVPHHHLPPAQLHLRVLVVDVEQSSGSDRVPITRFQELGDELVQQESHLGEDQVTPDRPTLEELQEVNEGGADLCEELVQEPGVDVVPKVDADDGGLVVRGQGAGLNIPVTRILNGDKIQEYQIQ